MPEYPTDTTSIRKEPPLSLDEAGEEGESLTPLSLDGRGAGGEGEHP